MRVSLFSDPLHDFKALPLFFRRANSSNIATMLATRSSLRSFLRKTTETTWIRSARTTCKGSYVEGMGESARGPIEGSPIALRRQSDANRFKQNDYTG